MFWIIVGALVFVFFILPLIFQVVLLVLGGLFESSKTLGWIGVIMLIILLVIIL